MRQAFFALMLLTVFPVTGFAQSLPSWSVWKNQNSSLLIVTTIDAAKGVFKGTFINSSTNYLCVGIPAQMTGVVDSKNNVMAVANFAPCNNTITIWKGTLNGKTLPMRWTLTYVDNNGAFQTMAGQDTFDQIN